MDMALQQRDEQDVTREVVPAQLLTLSPELLMKIVMELGLDGHRNTLLSVTMCCRVLHDVAQEVLYGVATVDIYHLRNRVERFPLVRRLSLAVPEEDCDRDLLEDAYRLLAHKAPRLRYLRITSGLLDLLYDAFSEARSAGTPRMPATEKPTAPEDESAMPLCALEGLQELEILYERVENLQDHEQTLRHFCETSCSSLTVLHLHDVPLGAQHLFTVVYEALGQKLVSLKVSLENDRRAVVIQHLWPTDVLGFRKDTRLPKLRHLELDERKLGHGSDFIILSEPVIFNPETWMDACPKLMTFVWKMSRAHEFVVWGAEWSGGGWYRMEIMRYKDALFQHWSTLERYHGPSFELSAEGDLQMVTECVFKGN